MTGAGDPRRRFGGRCCPADGTTGGAAAGKSAPPGLAALRRELHALAELSGRETGTAAFVARSLAACRPAELVTDLGGAGVAAVFAGRSAAAGPTVLLRAELDALPIPETIAIAHASATPGVAHKCGHDGHLAILLGVARGLAARPPARGRVILLAQPAEETGEGAALVAADPRLRGLAPDWLFALHNLPGYPRGTVLVRAGPFCAGSAGLAVDLKGATSHAAYPEQGRSPGAAMTELVTGLATLPVPFEQRGELGLVTVTHARLGEPGFGTTPGEARVQATIRADDDGVLSRLKEAAARLAVETAARHGLAGDVSWCEEFPVVWNDEAAVDHVRSAARTAGLEVARPAESPFRWSEDFGALLALGRGALFGLGAGRDHPPLHAQEYDFADGLLEPGVRVLDRLVRRLTDDG